jgi:hypothetical protein
MNIKRKYSSPPISLPPTPPPDFAVVISPTPDEIGHLFKSAPTTPRQLHPSIIKIPIYNSDSIKARDEPVLPEVKPRGHLSPPIPPNTLWRKGKQTPPDSPISSPPVSPVQSAKSKLNEYKRQRREQPQITQEQREANAKYRQPKDSDIHCKHTVLDNVSAYVNLIPRMTPILPSNAAIQLRPFFANFHSQHDEMDVDARIQHWLDSGRAWHTYTESLPPNIRSYYQQFNPPYTPSTAYQYLSSKPPGLDNNDIRIQFEELIIVHDTPKTYMEHNKRVNSPLSNDKVIEKI